eukprot:366131-Chlamydomonas_euryale.AAC.7
MPARTRAHMQAYMKPCGYAGMMASEARRESHSMQYRACWNDGFRGEEREPQHAVQSMLE